VAAEARTAGAAAVLEAPPSPAPPRFPRRPLPVLLLDFPRFAAERLARPWPPGFLLALWVTGMAVVIELLENKALFMRRYPAGNWPELWLGIAAAGLAAGALMYWLGGAWYHLRVRLAGGRNDSRMARRICLYAGIPAALALVLVELAGMAVSGSRYFVQPKPPLLEIAGSLLAAAAFAYGAWRGFRGARAVLGAAAVRGALLLIALPLYGYLLAFAVTEGVSMFRRMAAQELIRAASQSIVEDDTYGAEKKLRRALEMLTKEDAAERLEAGSQLGLAGENREDTRVALAGYRAALAASAPGSADYFASLGEIRIQEKRVPEATALFQQALRQDPECAKAHNNLGLIYLGEYPGGEADYDLALRHNLKAHGLLRNRNAASNLAQNYFLLERYADALPLYEELNQAPGRCDVRYQLGICCYLTGRADRAAQLLKAADFNRRGVSLWEDGRYAESEKFIRHALELTAPHSAAERILYICNLAAVLRERGDQPGRIDCYRQALALTPSGSAQYFALQGNLFLAQGKTARAILSFERCLALDPDNLRAHKNLGLIYLGDTDERATDYRLALRHNEKAFALQKSYETTWNLARNYYALERDFEALTLFEEIVAETPDDADAHYYLGMVCYDLGDLNRAQQHLTRAIALDPSLKDDEVEEILTETLGAAERKKT
jgi:tetratricopeptide (TPR) repeat protein